MGRILSSWLNSVIPSTRAVSTCRLSWTMNLHIQVSTIQMNRPSCRVFRAGVARFVSPNTSRSSDQKQSAFLRIPISFRIPSFSPHPWQNGPYFVHRLLLFTKIHRLLLFIRIHLLPLFIRIHRLPLFIRIRPSRWTRRHSVQPASAMPTLPSTTSSLTCRRDSRK